jgi:hypothetical protein
LFASFFLCFFFFSLLLPQTQWEEFKKAYLHKMKRKSGHETTDVEMEPEDVDDSTVFGTGGDSHKKAHVSSS